MDYPTTVTEHIGDATATATVATAAQRRAFEALADRLDPDELRRRAGAARSRADADMDDDERDRMHQRLADRGLRVGRDLVHLINHDDGYWWDHPDGSRVATVTRGPEPQPGTVHLLHSTPAADELTGQRRSTWALALVWSVATERMEQDVRDGDDVSGRRATPVLVPRVATLSLPVREPHLTTREAAELAGITPAGVRQLARRARARGVELHAPREQWPDARSPRYDRAALERYLADRR